MEKKIGIVIVIIVLGLLFATTSVSASTDWVGNYDTGNKTISVDQTIEKDVFFASNVLNNNGVVKGDLVALSTKFVNNGEIHKDLLLAAENADLYGNIYGNIRVAGMNIQINSQVGGNATLLTDNFSQQSDSIINGSLFAFANNGSVQGLIEGDIQGNYRKLTINGIIKGNINITAEELILGPQAKIEGDITYTSDLNLSKIEGASVSGDIERIEPKPAISENMDWERTWDFIKLIGGGIGLLSIMLVGVILTLIAPVSLMELGNIIQVKPFQVAGIGFLGFILIPIISIFSLLTIVGIPIGIILFIFYGLFLYLGRVAVGMWIGQRILNKEQKPLFHALLGILIIGLAGFIPYLGDVVRFATVIFGMGAILKFLYNRNEAPIK